MEQNNRKISNSLDEFWKARKESVTVLGVVTAIGAIFLTIPVPEIVEAKNALQMIQFLWLIVISITACWLALAFLLFSYRFEDHLSDKLKLDLGNYLSTAVFLFIAYLLLSLWRYMIALYKTEWTNLIYSISPYLIPLFFLVYIQLISRYYIKHLSSRFHFDLKSISLAIGMAIIPTVLQTIFQLNFDPQIILRIYTSYLTIFLIIFIGLIPFKYFKNKN